MIIYLCKSRTLALLVYSMVVVTGQLGNSLDFWMLLNNLDLEIGRILANISKHVQQMVL
jgi:hypothetical protein